MIRAIFREGRIQPHDPLPSGWGEGQGLRITEIEPIDDPEAIERWCHELDSIANRSDDPTEWEKMKAALAEADRSAKDQVRKEMGLDRCLDFSRTQIIWEQSRRLNRDPAIS